MRSPFLHKDASCRESLAQSWLAVRADKSLESLKKVEIDRRIADGALKRILSVLLVPAIPHL